MRKIPFELQSFDTQTTEVLGIAISGHASLIHNVIQINYQILGNVGNVLFPQTSATPRRKNQLWETTCFELFIAESQNSAYWEYNLSPSKDWAVLRFTDYRENKTDDFAISNIDIVTKIDNTRHFQLNSSLPLPDNLIGHDLCVGISAVIQDNSDNIYYYALRHCNQQPDFHDRNSFSITLKS